MFISSLRDVKEPTHYSRRVGDEVPGDVAVYGWVGIAGPHQLNSCQNFNLLKQITNKLIYLTLRIDKEGAVSLKGENEVKLMDVMYIIKHKRSNVDTTSYL